MGTARTTLQLYMMKLLSELLNLSSWNSTTGSLELGKKDFHSKYTVKEQLGKGGFGVVYSAVRRSDGLEVAVKEVNTEERLTLADLANHPWLCITSAPKPSHPPSSKKLLFSSKSVCHSSSSSSSSSLCSIVIA